MIAKDLHTGVHSSPAGQTYSTSLATSCLHMHSDIPASNSLALNVFSTTSTPVLESQNRYAALSIEECNNNIDIPLKGSPDGLPARAQAKAVDPAGHEAESLPTLRNRGANCYTSSPCRETQLMKVSGEESPTIVTLIPSDETWAKLKYTPCEVSLQDEQAALTQGSPITTVSVEPQLDGVLEKTARNPTTTPMSARAVVRPGVGINRQPSTDSEGMGQTGNSAFAVQAPLITLPRSGPLMKGEDNPSILPLNEQGRSSEGIRAKEAKTATGQEAASAQAVNRGHSVTVIEVPDHEDDTAYQIWLAKERTPTIVKKEAMGNEPSSVPLTKSDPSRWFKPFEVDWTLRVVCEARNDNAARAALFVWMHWDCVPKLTDKLLLRLCQGGEQAREQLYKLCEPPHYLRRRQNGDRDFSINVQLNPCTGRQTLTTKALIDSGCTSSSINPTCSGLDFPMAMELASKTR
ncbi:uncharacterized protein ARMOST_02679 [Armillaria ostoyae]|uniref:Uncharacterized protein n=1 Tax=Armillaria ostoyae TaxID=47428 RepID=A0A284QSK1_ARMOS|nr:uncharacterized protein ARMOST_02679 [Armillaria ostoyae]